MSPCGARRLTANSPVVSVPVLSNTKALMRAAISMSPTFLMSTPSRAAEASAATIAVGEARMKAHGHEITNTETTRSMSPVKNQTIPAITSTSGV